MRSYHKSSLEQKNRQFAFFFFSYQTKDLIINHENWKTPNICYESNREITIRIRSNLPQIIVTIQAVHRRMVLVVTFFVFLKLLFFAMLLLCVTMQVHDVEAIFHLH